MKSFSTIKKNKNCRTGFTLIEVLVSLGIISVLTIGVYSLIALSLKITADNKYYVEAINVANQKMEIIRNLPYIQVGLTSGIPAGSIPQYETITRDMAYTVQSFVSFYDDPYDGTEDLGTDTLGQDYKIATVEVSWQGRSGPKSLTLFTKIIPKTEEMSIGGGLLKINAIDSNGGPVPFANIHIENNSLDPVINFDAIADAEGKVSFPGAPEANESYEVIVGKTGYSEERTYPRTATLLQPTKPHLSVTEGLKTEENFTIDVLSTLKVSAMKKYLPVNTRLNTDASGETQYNPRVIIDNSGFKYVVWEDFRSASAGKIYAQKYDSDNAPQWASDIVISPANNQILPDIDTDNDGNLYVCWNDDSNGNQDAYLTKRASSDGSDSWGSSKINTSADAKDQTHARMIVIKDPSTRIVTAWQDDRNGSLDVFITAFDAARNPLWSPEIRINSNPLADGTNQFEPVIADISGHTLAVWTDARNGNANIYAQILNNAGVKQMAEDLRIGINSGSTKYTPSVAVDSNDNFYIAWTDERNVNTDIYAQKYNASGTPLWTEDIKVNTAGGTANQYMPDIAIDNNDDLYFVWVDERDYSPDIYAQKYDATGTPLWSEDQRINITVGLSVQSKPSLSINPDTNLPFVVWHDDRNGDFDIYGTEFLGPATSTQYIGESVPIRVISSKRIYENPIVPKFSQIFQTISGSTLDVPVEWDSTGYSVELITASTSYQLMLTEPAMPIPVLAGETKSIILYLE